MSGDTSTAADQSTPSPRSHLGPISPGDKRRATVLRQVIEPGDMGAECGVFKGDFSRALGDGASSRLSSTSAPSSGPCACRGEIASGMGTSTMAEVLFGPSR